MRGEIWVETLSKSTPIGRYRTIYNKFGYWWWRTEPKYVGHEESSVTEELWKLGRMGFW